MNQPSNANAANTIPQVVKTLVDVRASDTVYGDLYLRRARELLGTVLSQSQYNALRGIQADIDAALKRIRVATASQDWGTVESLAARVDELRHHAAEKATLSALGAAVYDTHDVSIDPFSPGFEFLPGFGKELAGKRDSLVAHLKLLARADARHAHLYESRAAFFAGLKLASSDVGATPSSVKSIQELEHLAMQAAEQGDMTQLRRYAQQLSAQQAKPSAAADSKSDTSPTGAPRTAYQSPVDLSAPFTNEVVRRARTLGLSVARAEPPPQSGALFDYVTSHIWQPSLSDTHLANEGTIRAQALVDESGFPPEMSGPLKDLVGQFLLHPFINSGGARYIPPFSTETVLVEDFPETPEATAIGELLSAVGLGRRRALARREIEVAVLEHGAAVLQERLLLDPNEFRLVCIPLDLYIGLGRDRGWGRQQQWTHFDGFEVFKNGQVRALVGGDARYGGLSDLVSIAVDDQRDQVVVRFAVIRRARQVARWL
jgi:hypothetical protein